MQAGVVAKRGHPAVDARVDNVELGIGVVPAPSNINRVRVAPAQHDNVVNPFILDSRHGLPAANKMLGSDGETHLKLRLCAILNTRRAILQSVIIL